MVWAKHSHGTVFPGFAAIAAARTNLTFFPFNRNAWLVEVGLHCNGFIRLSWM